MTDAEILAEIERLIQSSHREYRATPDAPQHKTYLALKAVAKMVRARQPDRIAGAIADLGMKLRGLDRSRDRDGDFSAAALRDVALEVRAKWLTIRSAMQFYQHVKGTAAGDILSPEETQNATT